MPEIFQLMGFILAGVLSIVSIFLWRKAMNLHLVMVESAQRYSSAHQRVKSLERDLKRHEEKNIELKRHCQKLEKSLSNKQQQTNTAQEKAEKKLLTLRMIITSWP